MKYVECVYAIVSPSTLSICMNVLFLEGSTVTIR